MKNLSAKLGPGNIAPSSKKTNKVEKKSAYGNYRLLYWIIKYKNLK